MSAIMAVFATAAVAQDIQLHYDFGRNIYSSGALAAQKSKIGRAHV